MKSNLVIEIIEKNETKSIYDVLRDIEIYVSKLYSNLQDENFNKVMTSLRLSLNKIAFIDKSIDGYDDVVYNVKIPCVYVYGDIIETTYDSSVCNEAYEICERYYDFDYVIMKGKVYEI